MSKQKKSLTPDERARIKNAPNEEAQARQAAEQDAIRQKQQHHVDARDEGRDANQKQRDAHNAYLSGNAEAPRPEGK